MHWMGGECCGGGGDEVVIFIEVEVMIVVEVGGMTGGTRC